MTFAFISDIHEDLKNLQQAFEIIREKGIETVVCLGDFLGLDNKIYKKTQNGNAGKCIDLIRNHCKYIVPGNHDLHAIRMTKSLPGVFDFPKNWYDLDLEKRKEISKNELWLYEQEDFVNIDEEKKEFVFHLPEFIKTSVCESGLVFSHHTFPDLLGQKKGFPALLTESDKHMEWMRTLVVRFSFTGHGHSPGVTGRIDDKNVFFREGKHVLPLSSQTWLSGPCLASNESFSGFFTFDFNDGILEVIKI